MHNHSHHSIDIVILGGGFAGAFCARTLCKRLGFRSRRSSRVALVSEENYMVFQPMLPEVAGASISPLHVANPLRLLCKGAEVFKARVLKIDWPSKTLLLSAGDFSGNVELAFQHLVLALGASINLSRIPGMPEHGFVMQTVGDAMRLRTTLIGRIEEANLETRPEVKKRLLTFVVVGGGYSGVETAGQILDLFHTIHAFYASIDRDDLQVFLIHSQDHLLPSLNRKLGEYCADNLRKRGLKLILNQRVRAVTANRAILQDHSTIDTNTVICTVGNAPHPVVSQLAQQLGLETEHGRPVTDTNCRLKNHTHLWGAGDCVAVPHVKGGACPPTAQFAMRQGILLGKNLARTLKQKPLLNFNFKGLGEMASIGRRTGVGEILGFRFSGFVAWWIWRTIYLGKLPRLDRKLRVVIDWTLELFFPRDINLFNPRYTHLLSEIHLESGDVLFHKGEPAFSLYIVKDGEIEISDDHSIVRTVRDGEHFGERALLDDQIWRFNSRATAPSTLVSIPASIFHQLVRGAGSIGRLFRKSATRYESREIIQSITAKLSDHVKSLRARDLMSRHLQTLRPDMPIRETLQILAAHPHTCYPVLRDGKCLGVVNREDFYGFLKAESTTGDTLLSGMKLVTLPEVHIDSTVPAIVETLVRSESSKLIVLDDRHQLAGIISIMDLVIAQQQSSRRGGAEVSDH